MRRVTNVRIEAVTEDMDNSELGKLINYIRGFASKLEAEKIKERSLRGRKACAREGRMPGGFHITYGYDYIRVEAENKRLNKAKETLKAQKAELEVQLKASQDAVINVPNLERFIEDIQKRLPELDFEGKRQALDMLNITVWLDSEKVEITGTIDTSIVLTPSFAGYSLINIGTFKRG